MQIRFSRITPRQSRYAAMCRLYQASFPPDERRALPQLRAIAQAEPRFSIVGMSVAAASAPCPGQFAGFASYWHFGTFVYVEHLATQPHLRGQGLGKMLVEHVKAIAGSLPLVLEVEPAVDHVTSRRIAFYQRLGFTLHSRFAYLQPAYSPLKNPLPLWLMTCNLTGPHAAHMLSVMADTIAQQVYRNHY